MSPNRFLSASNSEVPAVFGMCRNRSGGCAAAVAVYDDGGTLVVVAATGLAVMVAGSCRRGKVDSSTDVPHMPRLSERLRRTLTAAPRGVQRRQGAIALAEASKV